jgi:hypothetical protein
VIGYDFYVYWQIGRAILQGADPYLVENAAYPPATMILYTLFALLPFLPAFGLWSGLNFLSLFDVLRRQKLARQFPAWLAFTPSLFILLTGQIDLVFLWLVSWLGRGGWRAVLAAAAVTLKPQVALVVLPWLLLRWLLHERAQLLRWLVITLALHLSPLLLDANIYQRWIETVQSDATWRAPLSSGIFSLANLSIPVPLLVLAALAIAIWGLTRDEVTARIALLLAQPIGLWYEDVLLAGLIPWQLLVPVSWLAFLLSVLLKSSLPFLLIPLSALVWRVWAKRDPMNATSTGG